MLPALTQILVSVIGAVAIAVSASFIFAVLEELNVRIHPETPWGAFVALALAVGTSVAIGTTLPKHHKGEGRVREEAVYVAVATLIGIVGVGLTYLQANSLSASLSGDRLLLPGLVRDCFSLAVAISSAFVEESAFRGRIQIRLQPIIGAYKSEAVAGFMFTLVHFDRFSTWQEFAFVVLLAITNGRVAFKSQSTAWPIAVHAIANIIVIGTVLVAR